MTWRLVHMPLFGRHYFSKHAPAIRSDITMGAFYSCRRFYKYVSAYIEIR